MGAQFKNKMSNFFNKEIYRKIYKRRDHSLQNDKSFHFQNQNQDKPRI